MKEKKNIYIYFDSQDFICASIMFLFFFFMLELFSMTDTFWSVHYSKARLK